LDKVPPNVMASFLSAVEQAEKTGGLFFRSADPFQVLTETVPGFLQATPPKEQLDELRRQVADPANAEIFAERGISPELILKLNDTDFYFLMTDPELIQ
jgi:hypothetical protein